MRRFYDIELAAMKSKLVQGHGYEPYPMLFSRTLSWDQKEPLLKVSKVKQAGEGEGRKKRNEKKNAE
jgi:hypothetical protein